MSVKCIGQLNPETAIADLLTNASNWLNASPESLAQIKDVARKTACYYRSDKQDRYILRDLQVLENRWYASLKKKDPDYTIYEEPVYIGDLISCWLIYSSNYLRLISQGAQGARKKRFWTITSSLKNIRTVVDLGCGLGLTTAALKQIFPAAEVIGTNVPDAAQTRYAKMLGLKWNFKVTTNPENIDGADLVFASEYFEHFQKPIEHLDNVLDQLNPLALIIANAFGSISIGHFLAYDVGLLTPVSGKEASRLFNKRLRARGYQKIETGIWNNRPAYWSRTPVNLSKTK